MVTGEQKFPVYATVLQEIDKHGYGAFKTKVGVRNLFLFRDRLEVSYEKALSRHDEHNYGFKWTMPGKYDSNAGLELSYNFHRLFKGLDQGARAFSVFYARPDVRFDLEFAHRRPHVDTYQNPFDFDYFHKNYLQPSKKVSLKVWRRLLNRLVYGDIVTGDHLDVTGEAALPITKKHACFFKFDLNYRKYWDLCMNSYSANEVYR